MSNPVSRPGQAHTPCVSTWPNISHGFYSSMTVYGTFIQNSKPFYNVSIQAIYLSLLSFEGKMKTYICVYLLTVNC